MDKYCIYVHIAPNNKIYIGQSKNYKKRWASNGEHYKTCIYFYNAIQKYGWNNFKHLVLFENLTKDQADICEKEMIKKFDTTNSEFGYNLSLGGSGNSQCDKEVLLKKSETMKKLWQDKNFQERVRINSNKKLVQCLNTGDIFYSCEKAAQWCNLLDGAGIRKCCLGTRFSAGKHPITNEKLYWEYIIDKPIDLKDSENKIKQLKEKEKQNRIKNNNKTCQRVKCLNTNQIFNSMNEAARWCGLSTSTSIRKSCNDNSKSGGKHPVTGEKLYWEKIL